MNSKFPIIFISGWAHTKDVFSGIANTLPNESHLTATHLLKPDYLYGLQSLIAKYPTPPTIVSWSIGGTVALELLTTKNVAINKLVLIASTACLDKQKSDVLDTLIQNIKNDRKKTLKKFYMETLYPKTCGLREKINTTLNASSTISEDELIYGLKYLKSIRINKSKLRKIKCPVLTIHGTKDCVISKDSSVFLNTHIANSKLVLYEGASHNLCDTSRLVIDIKEFINE